MSINKVVSSILTVVLLSYCGIVSARYVQSDPIGMKGGLNTYLFVNGSPLNHVDEFGLECVAGVGCWTTPAERGMLANGNAGGYYRLACANGDEYACFAGNVAANSNWWGHIATSQLVWELRRRAKLQRQCIDVPDILNRIRLQLATGYANSLPQSQNAARWPTAKGVAQLHWNVFANFGLPPEVFGGSPLGPSIGPILPSIWCPNCR